MKDSVEYPTTIMPHIPYVWYLVNRAQEELSEKAKWCPKIFVLITKKSLTD